MLMPALIRIVLLGKEEIHMKFFISLSSAQVSNFAAATKR